MPEFTCGCHLNHASAQEHDQFWAEYKAKRKEKIERKEREKQKLAHPRTRAAKRRLLIHRITRSSVKFPGREPTGLGPRKNKFIWTLKQRKQKARKK